jgi:hypothetical protein
MGGDPRNEERKGGIFECVVSNFSDKKVWIVEKCKDTVGRDFYGRVADRNKAKGMPSKATLKDVSQISK